MTLEILSPSVTWANVVPSGGKLRAGNVLLPKISTKEENRTKKKINKIYYNSVDQFKCLLWRPLFVLFF